MRLFFRILKWCVLALLGVVGVFLLVNGVRAARAGARLEAKLTALRAAGEPASLADLEPQPIPPEQNADTYLRPAATGMVEAINRKVYAAFDAASQEEQEAFDAQHPLPEMLGVMRAALAEYPQASELVEQASNCPDYVPCLDYHVDANKFLENVIEEVQVVRGLARFNELRVLLALDAGQPQEALAACLTNFRLARLFDRDPTMSSMLTCLAVRGLAINDTNLVLRSGPLPPASHAALEQELALHDTIELARQSLRRERAYGIQAFHDMARGAMAPTARLLPWYKNDGADYLDAMQWCIDNVALPYAQWDREIEARMTQQDIGVLTKMVLPALQQHYIAVLRVQAQLRALRILNVLLSHDLGGDDVPALADLGLPADAVIDPYNGEPLQVKKLPDGWLVYSVGPNLEDDGGDLTEHEAGDQLTRRLDIGVGPLPPIPTTPPAVTPAAE